jgi:hypothetical protein
VTTRTTTTTMVATGNQQFCGQTSGQNSCCMQLFARTVVLRDVVSSVSTVTVLHALGHRLNANNSSFENNRMISAYIFEFGYVYMQPSFIPKSSI